MANASVDVRGMLKLGPVRSGFEQRDRHRRGRITDHTDADGKRYDPRCSSPPRREGAMLRLPPHDRMERDPCAVTLRTGSWGICDFQLVPTFALRLASWLPGSALVLEHVTHEDDKQ